MKFLILTLALVAAASSQNVGKPIAILRQAADISPEGAYSFSYETENGIAASESGAPSVPGPEGPAVAADGQFHYTSLEGIPIELKYRADENGFQPQGAHLPVPPPIPVEILKSLEWNAAHPEEDNEKPYRQ